MLSKTSLGRETRQAISDCEARLRPQRWMVVIFSKEDGNLSLLSGESVVVPARYWCLFCTEGNLKCHKHKLLKDNIR